MDQYNCCNLEDAPLLARILYRGQSVWFGLCLEGHATTFTMFIAPTIKVTGMLPYGGSPVGRYAVGLMYSGFAHFNLEGPEIYPSYIEEKLRLPPEDAAMVTQMLNAIRAALVLMK